MEYYYQKSLDKILEKANGRRIILCGTDLLTEIVYQNLLNMGVQVAYFISDLGGGKRILWKGNKNPV